MIAVPGATATSARATRRAPRRRTNSPRAGFAFVAPAVVLFTLTVLVPIGYSIYLSTRGLRVTGKRTIGGGASSVHRREVTVGLQNYSSAVRDPELGRSLLHMLTLGLIVVPIMLSLATLFALMLDTPRTRLPGLSRLAIFVPYAVPGVISSLLWGFLYLPGVSPFRHAAEVLNAPVPNFFAPSAITFSIANIAIWGGVGFNMVVLYTSARSIPRELFDAARIDGCSEFKLAWHIKLPLLRPALVMTSIFSMIAALQVFTEPWSLRSLTNVLPTTWVPLTKIYTDAFVRNDIYSAAASSVLLAAGTLFVSLIALRITQRRTFGEKR